MSSPTPPSPSRASMSGVVRSFGRFSGGWWTGASARRAWLLTGALATCLLGKLAVDVAMNQWNRAFFDALEKRDGGTLGLAVLVFVGLIAVTAAVGVGIVWTRETLQVRWREWLVARLMTVWLANKSFYRVALARTEPANPEYRIADDSRMATEPVVDFAIGLFTAVLTALAFVGILWSVGGSLTVSIGGTAITIPAYMMLAALVYGVAASLLTLKVGRPLVAGVVAKNEAEAKLRFELTRLRENAESVALVQGERDERGILDATYANLVRRWLTVVSLHAKLTWITNSSGPMIPVVPLLLATPKYLSGELSLGAVTQLAAAFVQVQIAISWLVDNYKPVAQWHASAQRVMAVVHAVEDLEDDRRAAKTAIRVEPIIEPAIEVEDLTVTDRSGRVLIADAALVVRPGEKVLVMGESGIGKSTLIRAIAGLWPWGEGLVRHPGLGQIAFVPQRPYLPLGSLSEVLLYPAVDLPVSRERVEQVLAECGLEHLVPKLGEMERWDQMLSAGERQRLAFARLLLQRPALAILDEATSALDEAGQVRVMEALRRELPETTVLSVGHRPGLEAFHDRRYLLVPAEDGARLVSGDTVASVVPRARRAAGAALQAN